MVVPGRLTAAFGAALMLLCAYPAAASGPAGTAPWYLDQYGGDPADMKTFYAGRTGIVMPTAPRPQLFISWRNLHGLPVGQAAGEALSRPCCGGFDWRTYSADAGWSGWRKARTLVAGVRDDSGGPPDREGPDGTQETLCFDEAFDLARDTLKDRVAKHGAASPEVRAWLAGQDAVFAACGHVVPGGSGAMPALAAGAPAWLVRDRAYQSAALALYSEHYEPAATGFAAITRDAGSPWRAYGPYLEARAWIHAALAEKTPATAARARAAVAALAMTPPGTFGHDGWRGMRGLLEVRLNPKAYFAALQTEMATPQLDPDIAGRFRDFSDLGDSAPHRPEILDWMATMRGQPEKPGETPLSPWDSEERRRAQQPAILAHAEARWRETHDPAWLIAALALTSPGDPGAAARVRQADATPRTSPAWLSLQYHAIRLTLPTTPAARSRQRLDAILARKDLSVSDRNVFLAQRTQVAASLDDFVRHALRKRLCASLNASYADNSPPAAPVCARSRWDSDVVQPSGVYDGVGDKGAVGFGEDARAILDRSPLAIRMAVAGDRRIPPALRLDIALTSFGRAVALQDDAAADRMAGDLAGLLPVMATEFRGVVAAKPGADKRFAGFLVLAKIPGVRTDLPDPYVRPEGRRVVDFQRYWADWIIVRREIAGARPPGLADYQRDGTGANSGWAEHAGTPDALTDLTCLGECGPGAAPLRLPDFVAAGQATARKERARFVTLEGRYDGKYPAYPPGGVSAWDEMLAYAKAHPGDPRVPEALYWLVHVGHYGGSHNHSGRRAFVLLHGRYPGSVWAKKAKYYND